MGSGRGSWRLFKVLLTTAQCWLSHGSVRRPICQAHKTVIHCMAPCPSCCSSFQALAPTASCPTSVLPADGAPAVGAPLHMRRPSVKSMSPTHAGARSDRQPRGPRAHTAPFEQVPAMQTLAKPEPVKRRTPRLRAGAAHAPIQAPAACARASARRACPPWTPARRHELYGQRRSGQCGACGRPVHRLIWLTRAAACSPRGRPPPPGGAPGGGCSLNWLQRPAAARKPPLRRAACAPACAHAGGASSQHCQAAKVLTQPAMMKNMLQPCTCRRPPV